MSNVGFGQDIQATRKRVTYTNTSGGDLVVYEGEPMCYDFDTTNNYLGYDKENSEEGTTTAEGYQNEGKYLFVENPASGNLLWFAGVVTAGGWCGRTVENGDSIDLDIWVPNGAIIPVRSASNLTINDAAYLTAGSQTLNNTGTVQVGWVQETVNRSVTNGLTLARLFLPDMTPVVAVTSTIGPSANVWTDIPVDTLRNNFSAGLLYENDYMGNDNLVTAESCVITETTSSSVALVADEGGALIVDSAGNATSDDGVEVQFTQTRVKPAAGRTIAFEARVKFEVNSGDDQYFIGLAATDTSLIAAGVVDDVVDKVGFFRHAATTSEKLSTISARTSAEVIGADKATIVDDTYMTLGIVIDGLTSVKFYVNGTLVDTMSTAASVPNAEICLSYVAKVEQTSADAEMTIDWVRVAQTGGRS